MEEWVAQGLRRGARRWPGVRLKPERFRARVQAAAAREGVAPTALVLEDLYLAAALEDGHERAWALFRERFRPFLLQALARLVPDPGARGELADDLLAGLYLPREGGGGPALATYNGRGSLRAWLAVTAVRRVYREARDRARAGTERGLRETDPAPAPPPEAVVAEREAVALLRAVLPAAVAALAPEDQTLLRLRYQRGLQLKELGRLYGLDKSTLCKRLQAVAARLKREIQIRLQARGGADLEAVAEVWPILGRLDPEGLAAWLGPEEKEEAP